MRICVSPVPAWLVSERQNRSICRQPGAICHSLMAPPISFVCCPAALLHPLLPYYREERTVMVRCGSWNRTSSQLLRRVGRPLTQARPRRRQHSNRVTFRTKCVTFGYQCISCLTVRNASEIEKSRCACPPIT